MRLFVAAYPPPDVRAHLQTMVDRLALSRPSVRSLRLAPAEQWHVTLAFLGEVPDERVDAAAAVLTALDAPAPTVRIAGAGRFGRGRFTIVWAGIVGEADHLGALATQVRRGIKRARLPLDARPLRAHLTLARPGDRLPAEDLAADLALLRSYQSPLWTMAEVRLMRSELGPNPRYTTIATRRLD